MNVSAFLRRLTLPAFSAFMLLALGQTFAADSIKGQVLGRRSPHRTINRDLMASAGAPKQLAQTKTDNDGRFELRSAVRPASPVVEPENRSPACTGSWHDA
jgi:hypothetical protein